MTCARLKSVWEWVSNVLRKWDVKFALSQACVFLGSGTGKDKSIMYYFIDTLLYVIWKCRNLATFRNKNLTSKQIIESCRREIIAFLEADMLFRGRDSFEVFWKFSTVNAVLNC